MRKAIVLAILALAVAFCSSTVFAYDHLITNDRAAIIDVGAMRAEAAILYWTASEGFDMDGESYDLGDDSTKLAIPVKFRYGMMDNLELFGVLGLIEKWDAGDLGETGVGDLWIGAKYGLMPDGMLTLRGALDIPIGDDDKGLGYEGGFGIDVAAMTTKQLDAICLDGQVGLRYVAEDGDTKLQPGIAFYVDGEASYMFSDVLQGQVGLELFFRGDNKFDGDDVTDSGRNWIELNLGAMYKLADNMGLKGDLLYNIMGKNTEKNMGVLIRLCYGL